MFKKRPDDKLENGKYFRFCSRCEKWYHRNQYWFYRMTLKDGTQDFNTVCKICWHERRVANRREKQAITGKPTEKTCAKCGYTKPIGSGFYRDDCTTDGYSKLCKQCKIEATLENRKRKKNNA